MREKSKLILITSICIILYIGVATFFPVVSGHYEGSSMIAISDSISEETQPDIVKEFQSGNREGTLLNCFGWSAYICILICAVLILFSDKKKIFSVLALILALINCFYLSHILLLHLMDRWIRSIATDTLYWIHSLTAYGYFALFLSVLIFILCIITLLFKEKPLKTVGIANYEIPPIGNEMNIGETEELN